MLCCRESRSLTLRHTGPVEVTSSQLQCVPSDEQFRHAVYSRTPTVDPMKSSTTINLLYQNRLF